MAMRMKRTSSAEVAACAYATAGKTAVDANHFQRTLFQVVSFLSVQGKDLPGNLAINHDQRCD